MIVVERKPVPLYEVECCECKSKIRYKASEVNCCGRITCPICGESLWATTLCPVAFEYVDKTNDTEKTVIEENKA